MRIASVLEPLDDRNLRLAAQAGVEVVVLRYPEHHGDTLQSLRKRVESYGMSVSVVEGYLPIEAIRVAGPEREDEIEKIKTLLRDMGDQGISILCYNFMPGSDWSRTSVTQKDRGGAFVTAFQEDAIPIQEFDTSASTTPDRLWENLRVFLENVVPVAEQNGVALAMHPDDPPIPFVGQHARIMHTVENFERLVSLVESPANTICFCQGTFAEMGVGIPATIRRLGPWIRYVHFRDIRQTQNGFVETFHDNGQTDMVAAIKTYHEIGFNGPMRPDHVPQLAGEETGLPGYTMLGRLFAYGYIRGLLQATE